jgi:uncharacterized membrane protein HdeD (DUF308 family)
MLVGIIFLCIGIAVLMSYGNSHKENWKHVNQMMRAHRYIVSSLFFFQFAKTSLPIVGGDYYVIYSIDSEY